MTTDSTLHTESSRAEDEQNLLIHLQPWTLISRSYLVTIKRTRENSRLHAHAHTFCYIIYMCMSEFEQYVNYVTCRKTFKLIRVQYSSNVSQKFISHDIALMQNYILPSNFHDLLC